MRVRGQVQRDVENKQWLIGCEAHIMQRVKRVFAGIPKEAIGVAPLADTPTNADELRWFLARFPLDVSAEDMAYLVARADAATAQQSIVERVLQEGYEPRQFTLTLPPRDYQRFAADLVLQQRFLLLADDMGLGKTISAITALSDPSSRPAIVVCGRNILRQWDEQIHRFLPNVVTYTAKTTKPVDLTIGPHGKKLPVPDVLLITYDRLVGWAQTLGEMDGLWKTVVYDEVQAFRRRFNGKKAYTHRYLAGLYLRDKIKIKMGLSGTPIYGYGCEIHNVVSILDEDALGTRDEFCRDYCGGSTSENAKVEDPVMLGNYLRDRGIMIRRTMADVKLFLPATTTIVDTVETDDLAEACSDGGVAELAKRILRKGGMGIDKMQDGRELDARLRQATGVAKAPAIAAFIRILVEEGRKVVVFGWHKAVYALWRKLLWDVGLVFFTGDESENQKDAAKKAFINNVNCNVIVISNRAAEGLDGLQHVSSTVVHAELDPSPKVIAQNTARVARDGQVNPVQAYILVSDDGSDPAYMDILGLKTAQSDGIFDPTKDVVEDQPEENRLQRIAESWLERHDPKALAEIRLANDERDAAKVAEKEAARVERERAREEARVTRGKPAKPAKPKVAAATRARASLPPALVVLVPSLSAPAAVEAAPPAPINPAITLAPLPMPLAPVEPDSPWAVLLRR